jgi:TonB family protein
MSDSPDQALFSLLPTSNEGRTRAFVTSSIVNLAMLGIALYVGATARQVIEQHYEETVLVMPSLPPPVKFHKPRPVAPPKIKVQPPRIEQPKPVQMEARLAAPPIPHVRPQIKLTPQVRPALASAMPAQNNLVRPSTRPVHLGDTFGVVPNPNAVRPATVAAIGNPYGGMEGPAVAPHGVVRSTGIGDSTRFGSGGGGGYAGGGRVASVGMPGTTPVAAMPPAYSTPEQSTRIEVLSKPPARYTAEARQLRIEGDVVLSVTFLASGQIVVHGVLHGLGHGLDEEAVREAQQIRFRPASVGGRAVDVTTRITITFQLA